MSVSRKVLRKMKKVMGVIGAVPVLTACSSQISRANGEVRATFDYFTGTLRFSGDGVIDGSWKDCYNKDSVRRVVIVNGIKEIGHSAFYGCISLQEITIPNSVTSIGSYAFSGCNSLKEINIPKSVSSIGVAAFWHCESLREIKIPNSVITIGVGAFRDCTSLTEITIPRSVTAIAKYTFTNCRSLTKITIPCSVTDIGQESFFNCKSLTEIKIPTSVTAVGVRAFAGCEELMTVEFEGFEKNSRAFKVLDLCYEKDKREYEAKKRDKRILSKIRQTTWNNLKSNILEKFFYKKSIEIAKVGYCAFGNCKKLSYLDTDGRKVKCCYANVFQNTPLEHIENEIICGKYIAKP